jgi:hypothetical protein
MHGVAGSAHRHRFVVLALEHFQFRARAEPKVLEKLKEAFILLVDTKDFPRFPRTQLRKEDAALFA